MRWQMLKWKNVFCFFCLTQFLDDEIYDYNYDVDCDDDNLFVNEYRVPFSDACELDEFEEISEASMDVIRAALERPQPPIEDDLSYSEDLSLALRGLFSQKKTIPVTTSGVTNQLPFNDDGIDVPLQTSSPQSSESQLLLSQSADDIGPEKSLSSSLSGSQPSQSSCSSILLSPPAPQQEDSDPNYVRFNESIPNVQLVCGNTEYTIGNQHQSERLSDQIVILPPMPSHPSLANREDDRVVTITLTAKLRNAADQIENLTIMRRQQEQQQQQMQEEEEQQRQAQQQTQTNNRQRKMRQRSPYKTPVVSRRRNTTQSSALADSGRNLAQTIQGIAVSRKRSRQEMEYEPARGDTTREQLEETAIQQEHEPQVSTASELHHQEPQHLTPHSTPQAIQQSSSQLKSPRKRRRSIVSKDRKRSSRKTRQ